MVVVSHVLHWTGYVRLFFVHLNGRKMNLRSVDVKTFREDEIVDFCLTFLSFHQHIIMCS